MAPSPIVLGLISVMTESFMVGKSKSLYVVELKFLLGVHDGWCLVGAYAVLEVAVVWLLMYVFTRWRQSTFKR